MMNLFANSSSNWVKYDKYEWKKADNGTLYITPTEDAKPSLYNPVKEYQDMVLAAINIGTLAMKEEPKESLQASIIDFACNYGLLGLMTALLILWSEKRIWIQRYSSGYPGRYPPCT